MYTKKYQTHSRIYTFHICTTCKSLSCNFHGEMTRCDDCKQFLCPLANVSQPMRIKRVTCTTCEECAMTKTITASTTLQTSTTFIHQCRICKKVIGCLKDSLVKDCDDCKSKCTLTTKNHIRATIVCINCSKIGD